MIDKMVNCTAAGRQDSTSAVYGDYMDGIKSIVFNVGTDLSRVNLINTDFRAVFNRHTDIRISQFASPKDQLKTNALKPC